MRIIDTGITKEILTGDNCPQLKIGDKCYTVDDRQITFEKIQEIQQDTNIKENEKNNKIFELALGKEATAEIQAMELSVPNFIHLTYCIIGAITGEDPNELEKAAKEQRKN